MRGFLRSLSGMARLLRLGLIGLDCLYSLDRLLGLNRLLHSLLRRLP